MHEGGCGGSGTWLYCGVHFQLACFHGIRGGSLHSTRCVPCFYLGLLPPLPRRCLGFHFQVFRWARFRLGVCFTRCALAVCVTLRLSGPWCPGWSCVNIMCWSNFLFVRQVVWEESKTEVLCCNCFWHFVPKLREIFKRSCFALVESENKTSCLSVARLRPLLLYSWCLLLRFPLILFYCVLNPPRTAVTGPACVSILI